MNDGASRKCRRGVLDRIELFGPHEPPKPDKGWLDPGFKTAVLIAAAMGVVLGVVFWQELRFKGSSFGRIGHIPVTYIVYPMTHRAVRQAAVQHGGG
jgi:hypothetical protein